MSDIELLQMEYLLLSTNVGDLTPQASMIFLPMSNFHMRQRRNEMGSKVLLKLLLSFQTVPFRNVSRKYGIVDDEVIQ